MRDYPNVRFLLAIALLACLPATVGAQEGSSEFADVIDVNDVLLDVVVTDRDGNVILGLQPDDFVVGDGDGTVDVQSATFYSNRAFLESAGLAERLGVSADEVPIDRYFILFFHDPRSFFPEMISQQLDALRWARRWVHQELLPNDYVAVLSYDYKLKVHQDFTTNDEEILRALDNVSRGKDPGANWPSRTEGSTGPSLRENLPRGNDLRKSTKKIYTALEVVGDASKYIIGRKNLLMFSMGFGEDPDFSQLTNSGNYRPNARYYPPMMQSLNDANIAVYTISLMKNLRAENEAQALLGSSLSLLADDTGGEYFMNFINFRDPMRQVVEDNNGYYLLSYPARAGDSGYRKVTVETTNPDFVIRARQGYRFGG